MRIGDQSLNPAKAGRGTLPDPKGIEKKRGPDRRWGIGLTGVFMRGGSFIGKAFFTFGEGLAGINTKSPPKRKKELPTAGGTLERGGFFFEGILILRSCLEKGLQKSGQQRKGKVYVSRNFVKSAIKKSSSPSR